MRTLVLASLIVLLSAPPQAGAYETDQFTNRLESISDSMPLLDEKVNETIRQVARDWSGPRDDWKFVMAVFRKIGGYHWVDKIERWVMNSPEIQRLQPTRRDSIYSGHPFWATRVAAIFGVGPTIKVNDVLIGSDKLGHFLSQGKKYYGRYLRTHDETKAARHSAFTERALFGQSTTGVYSNADLVANYEGFLFYRSLFEDNVIYGKPAILAWRGDHWEVQRPFTWADHVNAYWDEALNIDHYDSLLYPHMRARLQMFCPDFFSEPERYLIEDEEVLQVRYAYLELRDTSELRLDRLCVSPAGGVTAPAGRAQ